MVYAGVMFVHAMNLGSRKREAIVSLVFMLLCLCGKVSTML